MLLIKLDWETTRFIIGMYFTGFGIMELAISFKKLQNFFLQLFLVVELLFYTLVLHRLPRIPSIYAKYCLYIFSIHYHFGGNYCYFLQTAKCLLSLR